MAVNRARALAENLVRRFESHERQHPGQFAEALSFVRSMAQLFSAEGEPPRDKLKALLAAGRTIREPDCALQEALYAISAVLRAGRG